MRLSSIVACVGLIVMLSACGSEPVKDTPATTPAPPAQIGWGKGPTMAYPRSAHALVSTGDAIYAIAGSGTRRNPVFQVERLEGAVWMTESALPIETGLNAAAAVENAGLIYVIGGFEGTTNTPTSKMFVYEPASLEWVEGPDLPAARGGHAATVLDGKIHIVGGGNSERTIADHDVFDTSKGTWTSAAPLPRAMGSPALVAFDGKLYSIGGRSGGEDFGDVYIYDPATNAWTSGPSIDPRGTSGAVVYCNAIWVIGGESQARGEALSEVLKLEAGGTEWVKETPMPTARNYSRAAVMGGKIYVAGGNTTPDAMSHSSEGTAIVETYNGECSR